MIRDDLRLEDDVDGFLLLKPSREDDCDSDSLNCLNDKIDFGPFSKVLP
jgi:hypothetical protein